MSNPEKQITSITEDQLIDNGFQKSLKNNGLIVFSKRIPGASSDLIIMKAENGLFYAPQIHTPGVTLNEMISSENQENIASMDEVNLYYQKALKKLEM